MSEIRKLSQSVNIEAELQDLDLYKMMRVFERILERYELEKNKADSQNSTVSLYDFRSKKFLEEKITFPKRKESVFCGFNKRKATKDICDILFSGHS